MVPYVCFLVLLFLPAVLSVEPSSYNPIANSKAVVTSGSARFTVLTPQLIRLEYSTSGKFEDRATFSFLNRDLPVPTFSVSHQGNVLAIQTDALDLHYVTGSPFSAKTLNITSRTGHPFQWNTASSNSSNLLGTIRSLDEIGGPISLNCTQIMGKKVHDESLHCAWGLISRDGWVVVDDLNTPVMENDWPSNTPNNNDIDWYFFGHGHDYRQALADYMQVGGPITMVPRAMLGVIWTRWYDFNTEYVRQTVQEYSVRSIPLDVFVLDMDWHITGCYPGLKECNPKDGFWTGYTFDPNLFPYWQDLLQWFGDLGIINGANLHDASGVQSHEALYPQMARANGIDPNTRTTVAMNITDKTYALSLEDIVLKNLTDAGMDFWWIDWQQGGHVGVYALDVNPTIWLNQLRFTDNVRRGSNQRGLVLARFGGLGNHRYQVGFSGDVSHSWSSLEFQPYFSATATNVGYGYWSHDIQGSARDYELSTRWVQWGAWSAIYRTHDAGDSAGFCFAANPEICTPVSIWKLPSRMYEISRDSVVTRSELLPYHYNLMHEAYLTGLGPLRPMYYDWPEEDAAYISPKQYMLGESFLVSPITAPADETNMTKWSTWLPAGTWIGRETGEAVVGPVNYTRYYDLSDVPVFVRPGAVIPVTPFVVGDALARAARTYSTLEFEIYPGAEDGKVDVYEDDGTTIDYSGAVGQQFPDYATITAQYKRDTTAYSISVSEVLSGNYKSQPRAINIRLKFTSPPTAVTVNGKAVAWAAPSFPGVHTSIETPQWTYEGASMSILVSIPSFDLTASDLSISVTVDDKTPPGIPGGIHYASLAKHALDKLRVNPNARTNLAWCAGLGSRLSVLAQDPAKVAAELNTFKTRFAASMTDVIGLKGSIFPDYYAYATTLLGYPL